MSIITGMSVSDISQKAIANPGWTDITMPAPVFPVTRSMSKRKVETKC
jgi:acyl dehydratase